MDDVVEMVIPKININSKVKAGKVIYLFFKRFFDIFLSIIGLPFLLIATIIVKLIHIFSGDFTSIFYSHERVGKNGETFKLYKFRTMVHNSQEMLEELLKDEENKKIWEENHKFDNDPRITTIGKILRKTSVDELPQLLNIIKGDMSIVGPRPLIEEEVLAYKNKKQLLLSIRPGLTGWWAVNGRSCTSNKKRMKLELFYVKNMSLKFDIKIFFMTFIKVFTKDGAK